MKNEMKPSKISEFLHTKDTSTILTVNSRAKDACSYFGFDWAGCLEPNGAHDSDSLELVVHTTA